jgi:hypothetical protein
MGTPPLRSLQLCFKLVPRRTGSVFPCGMGQVSEKQPDQQIVDSSRMCNRVHSSFPCP